MFNPVEPRLIATANSKEGVGLWDIRKPRRSDRHRPLGPSAIFHVFPSAERLLTGSAGVGAAPGQQAAPASSSWPLLCRRRPTCAVPSERFRVLCLPPSSLLRYGGSMSLQSAMSVRFNSAGTHLLALRRRLPPVLYELHSRLPSFQFDNQGYFNSCTMKSCCFAGDRDQVGQGARRGPRPGLRGRLLPRPPVKTKTVVNGTRRRRVGSVSSLSGTMCERSLGPGRDKIWSQAPEPQSRPSSPSPLVLVFNHLPSSLRSTSCLGRTTSTSTCGKSPKTRKQVSAGPPTVPPRSPWPSDTTF